MSENPATTNYNRYAVMVVVGTRPEAIKLAPLIKLLKSDPDFRVCVVATAQHREMLDQVFNHFDIKPDNDLNLMTSGQSLAELTSRCIINLDPVVKTQRPDLMIAQGDTTTTFVAGLVAFYNRVPFAHIEAGLRTYDYENPFPEEFNRQAVSRLAQTHFAPTQSAAENLLREGFSRSDVFVTGNTVIDALYAIAGREGGRSVRESGKLGLVTVHRRENFGEPLVRICAALREILERAPDLRLVWPVHPNPNVEPVVKAAFSDHPRVRLLNPLPYGEFVHALVDADFVITDSGGIQEEAPALRKPVVVLREHTERPEAVAAGGVLLVGTDVERIRTAVERLVHDPDYFQAMRCEFSPYGDGLASRRIVERLKMRSNLASPETACLEEFEQPVGHPRSPRNVAGVEL